MKHNQGVRDFLSSPSSLLYPLKSSQHHSQQRMFTWTDSLVQDADDFVFHRASSSLSWSRKSRGVRNSYASCQGKFCGFHKTMPSRPCLFFVLYYWGLGLFAQFLTPGPSYLPPFLSGPCCMNKALYCLRGISTLSASLKFSSLKNTRQLRPSAHVIHKICGDPNLVWCVKVNSYPLMDFAKLGGFFQAAFGLGIYFTGW